MKQLQPSSDALPQSVTVMYVCYFYLPNVICVVEKCNTVAHGLCGGRIVMEPSASHIRQTRGTMTMPMVILWPVIVPSPVADALQPLIVAFTADVDPITANNTDAATCACSHAPAGCPSHTPSAARQNTYDICHMHTLRVFVVSRAFADGFDLAANAGCPPVAAHADPAPSTFLASAAAADVISTLNPAPLSTSLGPDGDGAPSLALDPSPAPAAAYAIPPLASKSEPPLAYNSEPPLACNSEPPLAYNSEPPLAYNSEFRSAGFLQRVCDGLMHMLQPVTQLLVEIIPLPLPTDVMDARCFVRQVPNQLSRAAAAKFCFVLAIRVKLTA